MAEDIPSYKVILAGLKGVGKSTLLGMLDSKVDVEFGESILLSVEKGESSRGRTKLKIETKCNDSVIYVWVWDTAGMEKHSGSIGMTKSYFQEAHGAILVYERGRDETKTALQEWAKLTRAESPDCVLSLWCNNRNEEIGTSELTRDTLTDIASHYKIKDHLMFTYVPGRDTEVVHTYFNTLMCEIHRKLPPRRPHSESVKLESDHSNKKCCSKRQ
ncbi:PREDICTED: ras-related protein Rab-25-like [Amphimedon queenslandica]|uniref:Uncharacterized protein n=1 Tax=Amphimedon queenslandica TaxID=400682 RepID=A0A1X7VE12_AMPQE|nr:PREDICTED: ras-related protein Rab-25-like [Amphimedon queenslandica]|eukprot:XP_011402476.1 PREDICTED: ras-related protein Rab-25-like [Amphimedon queenslandica]